MRNYLKMVSKSVKFQKQIKSRFLPSEVLKRNEFKGKARMKIYGSTETLNEEGKKGILYRNFISKNRNRDVAGFLGAVTKALVAISQFL